MWSPGVGLFRALRVIILASAVLVITIGAHVLGGGVAPEVIPLILLAGLTVAACHLLLAKPISFVGLLGALGVGQFLLHHAFEFCSGLDAAGVASPSLYGDGGMMFAKHAAATILAAVVLNWGERSIWRLWAWLTLAWLPAFIRLAAPVRRQLVLIEYAVPALDPGTDSVMGRAPPSAI